MSQTVTYGRKQEYCLSAGAMTGTQLFHLCCWLYLVAFFILPDGCGFRLGFLFSAKRIMLFVCYALILFSRKRLNQFLQDVRIYIVPNIFLLGYEFVRFYTAVYRRDIYSIAGSILDEVLVFYLFAYILKHEISEEEFVQFIRVCLAILCVEGIWEAATGINLFRYLNFASDAWSTYGTRAGVNRICGNCRHSIHYGIYITILFILSCADVKRNKLYLFRNPILFALATVCVFLSGSRAPLGIYLLSLVLICLFSGRDERIKAVILLVALVSFFAIFTMIVYRTEIGRQIMFMLTAMWDAVFDTEYSVGWGGSLRGSTEYRVALAKVFDLWYLNKLVGRGASYGLSVVIDGYWLQSTDNSYVAIYITYAYPGIVTLVMHGLITAFYSLKRFWVEKKVYCLSILIVVISYFLNIWFVAMMGTYIYIWMLFAWAYIACINKGRKSKNEF